MFNEPYIIKFNLLKKDGYWEIGKEIQIDLKIKHGDNEKNNHIKAENKFKKQFKGREFKIISVTYC